MSHPLFVTFKPGPFGFAAHFRSPPLLGFSMIWMSSFLQAKVCMTVGCVHTLWWQKSGCVQFERF